MSFIRVRNWERFQHYTDRRPPWIKLHSSILRDYEFTCLHDASKLHLILIWVLASQLDNEIPADEKWLTKQQSLDKSIKLKPLLDAGFIECDSTALAQCLQGATPETETETEAYTENPLFEDDFERWWDAYAKKVGRKPCQAKWKRLKWKQLGISPEFLINDTLSRHEWDDQWQRGYQPNPLTYLNQQRWTDEITKPKRDDLAPADRAAQDAARYLRGDDGAAMGKDGGDLRGSLGTGIREDWRAGVPILGAKSTGDDGE